MKTLHEIEPAQWWPLIVYDGNICGPGCHYAGETDPAYIYGDNHHECISARFQHPRTYDAERIVYCECGEDDPYHYLPRNETVFMICYPCQNGAHPR